MIPNSNPVHPHQMVNLWNVTPEGMILGLSGEVAFLYEVSPSRDTAFMEESSCESHVKSIRGVLASMPAGSSASFMVEIGAKESPNLAMLRERLSVSDKASGEIIRSKLSALSGRPQRTRSTTLVLSVGPADFLRIPFFPAIFFPGFVAARKIGQKHEDLKQKLASLEGLLLGQAGMCGAGMRRLSREEVLGLYWRSLNPSRAGGGTGPERIRPYLSLRSQLALSQACDEKDWFWADGHYHRAVSLHFLGDFIETGGVDRLISRAQEGTTLVFNFMALDLERTLDRAKAEARRAAGLSFLQGTKNYEAQAKASELDELITLVRSKGERLFLFSCFGLLRDRDRDALGGKALKFAMQVRECLGGEALMEDLLHKRFFSACLPFGTALSPRRHILTGEACARLAPLSSPWPGSASPGILLKSREGEIVSVDPFEGETPRHGIVIGSTGSGKSFSMNYLVLSLYALDPRNRFVIVDVGGSYKRLCEVLGGSYFAVRLSEEFAINPFPPKEAVLDGKGGYDPDLIGYLMLLVEKMLDGKSSQNRKRILEEAIKALYSQDYPEPLLGDLRSVLEKFSGEAADRVEAQAMARSLRFYTDGIYGKLLNSPGAVKPFEGRMTVFDLAGLKEHKALQSILVFLIGFGLAGKLKNTSCRKIVILDEGWEFFNDPAASELISRLYRTARKFNGLIVSVSQSPRDFIKSQSATAMLANSYWKAFLRLDMGHETLQAFGLNSRQVEAVKGLEMKKRSYSEMLLCFGENSRVLRLEPTPLEYWIATTNAEECVRVEEAAGKTDGAGRFEALKELAREELACA